MERYRYDEAALKVMENSRVPFAVYQFIDKRVVTLVLSAGFCDLFGYGDRAAAYELMDHDMYRDTHPDDVAHIADEAFRFATEGGAYNVVYRTRARSGADYTIVHAHGEHVYTETGERLAVVWYTDEGLYAPEGAEADGALSGAFSRLLRDEVISRQSHYDSMTGLPNMSYFFELAELGRAALEKRGRQTAMLFFDLCELKSFNRRYGFAEGGRLIHAFSRALAERFGNENCGHFSGDQFGVYTDAEGLDGTLEALFADCKGINGGKSLPVRAGICLWEDAKAEASSVCDRAKMACDTLRGAYHSASRRFDESLLTAAAKRQYFIDNLDRAIEEGWIQAYYQPIIRAANGHVCDEEALVRWIDPERGAFMPSEFTPVLEEANLIYKLDLHMVELVLAKMKLQREAGLYIVPSSVNFSRSDFDSCDLVEEIRRRVDDAGVNRELLTVEITESVIGSDFEYMKKQVDRFHALGFRVWMDDFGSGYSSLDVLQSIHFDLIKFDMLFMNQFESSPKCRIILTELMKMAIGLGVETVTEGVETAEQVEFLREVGCTRLQGYYYGRPISMEEILYRYETGNQIGFEDPDESEYYAAIGRINLYDLSAAANERSGELRQYFDTLPMSIIEINGDEASIVRSNKSYREFMERMFGVDLCRKKVRGSELKDETCRVFFNAVKKCAVEGARTILGETVGDNVSVHAFARRIAVNPVTGTAAVVTVVLSVG